MIVDVVNKKDKLYSKNNESFKDKNKKVLIIPGNHESFATTDFLASVYGVKNIHTVRNGSGLLIFSTPKGILSGREARREQVGGEALFKIC